MPTPSPHPTLSVEQAQKIIVLLENMPTRLASVLGARHEDSRQPDSQGGGKGGRDSSGRFQGGTPDEGDPTGPRRRHPLQQAFGRKGYGVFQSGHKLASAGAALGLPGMAGLANTMGNIASLFENVQRFLDAFESFQGAVSKFRGKKGGGMGGSAPAGPAPWSPSIPPPTPTLPRIPLVRPPQRGTFPRRSLVGAILAQRQRKPGAWRKTLPAPAGSTESAAPATPPRSRLPAPTGGLRGARTPVGPLHVPYTSGQRRASRQRLADRAALAGAAEKEFSEFPSPVRPPRISPYRPLPSLPESSRESASVVDMRAVLDELKALRDEVKGLREDQKASKADHPAPEANVKTKDKTERAAQAGQPAPARLPPGLGRGTSDAKMDLLVKAALALL